jgi:hypothetical protein
MAETLTGEISNSGTSYRSFTLSILSGYTGPSSVFEVLNVYTIQNTLGFKTLIRMDNGKRPTYSVVKSGRTAPVSVYHGAQLIGTGTFGYVRLWNFIGVEQDGYQYLSMDTWDVGSLTGDESLTITGGGIDGITCTIATCAGGGTPAAGNIVWAQSGPMGQSGNYINYNDLITKSSYVAMSPSGLGINGTLNKTVSGIAYGSRGLVVNATDMHLIQSQDVVSTNNMIFNIWNATSIKLGMQDALGVIVYSPALFTASVAPIPTPTPRPGETDIPNGYYRTHYRTTNGITGAFIIGTNIQLHDNFNNSWHNSTADADGLWYIDTLPEATIDAYAQYTAIAGAYTPVHYSNDYAANGGTYNLEMFPSTTPPPTGHINLYITAKDDFTYENLASAQVDLTFNNAFFGGYGTGSSGTILAVVPNNTTIYIKTSKVGYNTGETVINSGENPTNAQVVYIHRTYITATPTATPVIPGVTVTSTGVPVSTYTQTEKGTRAFGVLIDSAYDIMVIAVGCVIIWLMWLVVYLMTGGKIIDKIMRRGRR